MPSCRFALVLLVVAVLASQTAQAGLADPTPTLGGQPSFHLWSVPGVVNNGYSTIFACSNSTSTAIRIGVEVFGAAGGASLNNASATSLVLQAGASGGFITQVSSSFITKTPLGIGLLHDGSARILATASTGVICSAILADPATSPAASMTNLTVVSPNTQAMAASLSGYGTTALAGLLLATGATAAMMMRRGSVA
jgi:hypothetical protein